MFKTIHYLKENFIATIARFEEIVSWQESKKLNKVIGDLIDTGKFKKSYCLVNQVEGSAGSIIDNIAGGFERGGNKEFIQFLYIAKGSCGELSRNSIGPWIEDISYRRSLMIFHYRQ